MEDVFIIEDAKLDSLVFNKVPLSLTQFKNCTIKNANFRDKEDYRYFVIEDSQVDQLSFKNKNLIEVKFINSVIKNTSFVNVKFIESNFSKTHFINSNFQSTIFEDCKITGVKFKKCNLTNARFKDKGIYVFNNCYAKNEDWLEKLAADWGMSMDEMQQHYKIELKENEELGKHYLIRMLKPHFPREGILQF